MKWVRKLLKYNNVPDYAKVRVEFGFFESSGDALNKVSGFLILEVDIRPFLEYS